MAKLSKSTTHSNLLPCASVNNLETVMYLWSRKNNKCVSKMAVLFQRCQPHHKWEYSFVMISSWPSYTEFYGLVNSMPWIRKQKPQFCSTNHVREGRIRSGSRGTESCPSPSEPLLKQVPENIRVHWTLCFWRPDLLEFADELSSLDYSLILILTFYFFCSLLWKLNVTIYLFISVKYERSMSSTILLNVAVCEPKCSVFQDGAHHPSKWQHQETLYGPVSQLSAK